MYIHVRVRDKNILLAFFLLKNQSSFLVDEKGRGPENRKIDLNILLTLCEFSLGITNAFVRSHSCTSNMLT